MTPWRRRWVCGLYARGVRDADSVAETLGLASDDVATIMRRFRRTAALALTYAEGYSIPEIVDATGVNRNTVYRAILACGGDTRRQMGRPTIRTHAEKQRRRAEITSRMSA